MPDDPLTFVKSHPRAAVARRTVVKHGKGAGGRWMEADARRMWSKWRAFGASLEAFARRSGFGGQRLQ